MNMEAVCKNKTATQDVYLTVVLVSAENAVPVWRTIIYYLGKFTRKKAVVLIAAPVTI